MKQHHRGITVCILLTLAGSPALAQEKQKPVKPFSFITDVPGNLFSIVKTPFKKENLPGLGIVAATTGLLLLWDQPISDLSGKFFEGIGIEQQSCFKPIEIGDFHIMDHPCNINSFFYQLGEPTPTILFAGGFFLYGKLAKDNRASRTASEIVGSFMSTVLVTQTIKRITGREAPSKATIMGGVWHWFPSWKKYNERPTHYLAFPSGHMANMMSLVTVISENFPEKKWIKPVGYSVIALTALSQQNNKTHWVSDIPLGLAIGYVSGKVAHLRNEKRKEVKKLALY